MDTPGVLHDTGMGDTVSQQSVPDETNNALITDPGRLLGPPASGNDRELPGVATGGFDLPDTDVLLQGSAGNAGKIPRRIADALRGRSFKNFADFRAEFWKAVARDPALSQRFSPGNRASMASGNSPRPVPEQWYGEGTNGVVYNLHHAIPLNQGGEVYNLDNIYVVTPRFHQSVLDPDYHGGRM